MSEAGMLLWRLNPNKRPKNSMEYWENPFEHIAVVVVDEKMIIFIVHNGQGIVLEDSHEMFPSDELVAKLRLLLK